MKSLLALDKVPLCWSAACWAGADPCRPVAGRGAPLGQEQGGAGSSHRGAKVLGRCPGAPWSHCQYGRPLGDWYRCDGRRQGWGGCWRRGPRQGTVGQSLLSVGTQQPGASPAEVVLGRANVEVAASRDVPGGSGAARRPCWSVSPLRPLLLPQPGCRLLIQLSHRAALPS